MTNTNTEARTIQIPAGLGPVSAKLIERLEQGKPGDVLTDEQLEAICGRETGVGKRGYCNLQTAIRHCLREHDVIWHRVHGGDCIKCSTPGEAISNTESKLKSIGRKARWGLLTAQAIDTSALSNEDRVLVNVKTAQFGTMALISRKDTAKKLIARNVSKPLESGHLLEAFKAIGN